MSLFHILIRWQDYKADELEDLGILLVASQFICKVFDARGHLSRLYDDILVRCHIPAYEIVFTVDKSSAALSSTFSRLVFSVVVDTNKIVRVFKHIDITYLMRTLDEACAVLT